MGAYLLQQDFILIQLCRCCCGASFCAIAVWHSINSAEAMLFDAVIESLYIGTYINIGYDSLQLRHNGRDSVSNHQPHHCLLNRLFRRRSNKTSKLRVTGLCEGNSPGTDEFPAQRASNVENAFIWWLNHVNVTLYRCRACCHKIHTLNNFCFHIMRL